MGHELKLILNLMGSTDHLNVVGRIELEKQFQRFYVQRFKEQSKKNWARFGIT